MRLPCQVMDIYYDKQNFKFCLSDWWFWEDAFSIKMFGQIMHDENRVLCVSELGGLDEWYFVISNICSDPSNDNHWEDPPHVA